MIFIIISLLLFLGIAFFQTIQGAFSALIMLVLTILSAAVAMNYYAPLSQAFLLDKIYDYADAASLIVLFTATLVILRTIADNFVRGNIVLWEWPDRIIAGLLSIPTALILVGMGALAFQMLPFDDQVLWFNHFSVNDNTKVEARSGLFPYGDDFAAWLMGTLSQGSLKNETDLDVVHPDWPGEASAQRIAVQRESKHTVLPGAVSLASEGAWRGREKLVVKTFAGGPGGAAREVTVTTSEREVRDERHYYLVVRLEMGPQAMDADGYYRFSWGQFRLVGFPNSTDRKHTLNLYALGARDPSQGAKLYCLRSKVPYQGSDSYDQTIWETRNYGLITKSGKVDVVFEAPNEFVPWFLEYKRWARVMIPKVSDTDPTGFEAKNTAEPTPAPKIGGTADSGWHSANQVAQAQFTTKLPFKLMSGSAGGEDTAISGNRLAHGRISGTLGGAGGLDGGGGTEVTDFDVSSDKRLLRVECNFVSAGNPLMQNIFGAVGSVAQQKVMDSQRHEYLPVGKYVILDEPDGSKQVELIYNGTGVEGEASGGREQFQTISRGQLQNRVAKLGFLYAIPPGTRLERFEAGRPFEAQYLQLTAPN